MLAAARFAASQGWRLNHLVTVRWTGLLNCEAETPLARIHPADAASVFLQRLRKFLRHHGVPWAAIWRPENSAATRHHLHVGLHLPKKLSGELARYLADKLETAAPHVSGSGIIAQGESRNWDLRRDDGRGDRPNTRMVAYLGKGEPDEIERWGRIRENKRKPIRDGRARCIGQLPIEGTAARELRYGIARTINAEAQRKAREAEGEAEETRRGEVAA